MLRHLKLLLCGGLLCLPLCVAAAGEFALTDLQGKTHHLADYRGKWLLVNFWATWCPPCLNELPELKNLHNYHKNKDLEVVGVVMDYPSAKLVADFVRKHDIPYPVVLGNRKIAAQIGELEVLPTSYLYNPSGELVSYQAGELTQEAVESYLKGKK